MILISRIEPGTRHRTKEAKWRVSVLSIDIPPEVFECRTHKLAVEYARLISLLTNQPIEPKSPLEAGSAQPDKKSVRKISPPMVKKLKRKSS